MSNTFDQKRVTNNLDRSGAKKRSRYLQPILDSACFILLIVCFNGLLSDLGSDGSSISQVSAAYMCPKFSCNNDQNMNDSSVCFQHSANDPVTEIKIQKCENASEKCFVPDNNFAWVQSDLQFKSQAERKGSGDMALSQLSGKIFKQECVAVESLEKNLNNGRKCTYAYQCKSRVCDSGGTGACVGREEGETCSIHDQCHKQLACRPNNIWPFETTCLPLSEVGSQCETEFDCKTRNFCWKLNDHQDKICLEKHSAPDYTEFVWDVENYPVMTKESIMIHGQYCKSGIASMQLKEVEVDGKKTYQIPQKGDPEQKKAVCLTIDSNIGVTTDPNDLTGTPLSMPYQCTPDGQTQCLYKKQGQTYFKLLCECGLREDNGAPIGYCPIPDAQMLLDKNEYMRKMWIGDNCHTLDRHKFRAQLECGIGTNFGTLSNASFRAFQVNYYPYIQEDNAECMEQFISDSKYNILSHSFFSLQISKLSLILTVFVYAMQVYI